MYLYTAVFVLFGFASLDAVPSKQKAAKFRNDYKYVSEVDGWLKLHRTPADWFDARERCQLEGADLASPSDQGMLQAMTTVINGSIFPYCGVYTGIHAWFAKGFYNSLEGIPLSKMPVDFIDSQTCPTSIQQTECTVLLPSGAIDAVDCEQLYSFICYRKDQNIHNNCECGTVDPEYKFYVKTNQCYKYHHHPKTWSNAYRTCQLEGGHLAIINSLEESEVISNIFQEHPSQTMLSTYKDTLLLGFKNLKGTWTTIHGQSLQEAGYARWSPGQPDSSAPPTSYGKMGFCGAMFRTGLLDDIWCDVKFAFICEKHPNSLQDE